MCQLLNLRMPILHYPVDFVYRVKYNRITDYPK
jgi:hypothetical protein